MMPGTEQHRTMLAKTVSNLSPDSRQGEPIGVINFLTGGNEEIVLSKKLTKIGKDSSSDIVVNGLMVGKTAATISIRFKGYYLNYVGGIAKPKVSGKSVKSSIKLSEFDKIQIGSFKNAICP